MMRKPIDQNSIVLLGDSLTEGFNADFYYPDKGLVNRGMSGDMTDHVLFRMEEITKARPAKILLMIGINDLFQGVGEKELSANYEKIVNEIVSKCPNTKLIIQSILPINDQTLLIEDNLNTHIYRLNDELRSLAKRLNLQYIDLHSEFLNNQGQMDSNFTFDGAHLNKAGYDLWAGLLENYL